MTGRRGARAALAALALAAIGVLSVGAPASAHTLASSTVRVVERDGGLDGTITLAVASLDRAFDATHRSTGLSAERYAAEVEAYVGDHLTIRGSDGRDWTESFTTVHRETTEGIETITLGLAIDAGSAGTPEDFTVAYDAVIEAVAGHEAVLVVETSAGSVSTPGVFTADHPSVAVGEGTDVGVVDMIRLGFHHVLDGADHLLFLLTLLLPAPLAVSAGRWARRDGVRASVRKVTHVVSAFTLGHSLTLVAAALGWITVPSRPVEVLIAASVAVSALHAVRPLVRGGEPVIAATFGLVHGMAFAGVLGELGLQGRTSVLALLAFNVGIEAAQLVATAAVFPSLQVLSRTDGYARVRLAGAAVALVASGAWMLDRLGLVTDPFAGIEQSLVSHIWWVPVGLAALAAVSSVALRTPGRPRWRGRRAAPTPLPPRPAHNSTPTRRRGSLPPAARGAGR